MNKQKYDNTYHLCWLNNHVSAQNLMIVQDFLFQLLLHVFTETKSIGKMKHFLGLQKLFIIIREVDKGFRE